MYNMIEIPFDGRGRTPQQAAEIILNLVAKAEEKRIRFLIPVQWSWNWDYLIHPAGGLLEILNCKAENYTFSCHSVKCRFGVNVTPN